MGPYPPYMGQPGGQWQRLWGFRVSGCGRGGPWGQASRASLQASAYVRGVPFLCNLFLLLSCLLLFSLVFHPLLWPRASLPPSTPPLPPASNLRVQQVGVLQTFLPVTCHPHHRGVWTRPSPPYPFKYPVHRQVCHVHCHAPGGSR